MPRQRYDADKIRRLREIWNYDPETGAFTRKEKQRGGSKPSIRGDVGAISLTGYRLISIDAVHYLAHRLAWAYVKGEWPTRAVEHINGNRLDNRISNLREKWGNKEKLTQERAKELLDYNPETGVFTWKVRSPRANIGQEAGCMTGNGYRFTSVDGTRYLNHRLAWFWTYGRWPENYVDHINGIRDDNRISNLRDVTLSQNTHNTKKIRKTNKLGVRGVSQKKNRFMARIVVQNQIMHLGTFKTIEEAKAARIAAEEKYGIASHN